MDQLTERYRIARLIARKILGMISEEETNELNAWENVSVRHREEMTRIEKRLKDDLRRGRKLDVVGEWDMFQQKLSRKRTVRWWKYAAAVVVVGVCAVFGMLQLREMAPPVQIVQSVENNVKEYKAKLILDDGSFVNITDTTCHVVSREGANITASNNGLKYETGDARVDSCREKYNTLIVPRGGEYELLLADGTHVWMNSESKLVYPVQFIGERREVEMEGEVCFQVAKREQQPFIVKTRNVAIEVLGTFFNVEAYPENRAVTTTLVEGRVNVSDGQQHIIMTPNQQVVAENGKLELSEVDAMEVVSWTRGVCYFSEASLENIMDKLARWYDVDVFFTSESAKTAHFSLEIERYDNIAAVLSKIEKTGRVKFKINGRTITVEE